jgi:hypothetical protein
VFSGIRTYRTDLVFRFVGHRQVCALGTTSAASFVETMEQLPARLREGPVG